MRRKAFRHEQREIMVITWFAIRIQHDNDSYASLYEIARGVGMSPSSHLRRIVDRMVSDKGTLESSELNRPGRWQGRGYRLKEGTFQRPAKRQIKINFTSSNIRQTELAGF